MNARAVAAGFRKDGPTGPGTGAVNWTMVAVAVTVLVHAASAVAWASAAGQRISALEQNNPPGAVARLEERVDGVRSVVDRIDQRLQRMELRP